MKNCIQCQDKCPQKYNESFIFAFTTPLQINLSQRNSQETFISLHLCLYGNLCGAIVVALVIVATFQISGGSLQLLMLLEEVE